MEERQAGLLLGEELGETARQRADRWTSEIEAHGSSLWLDSPLALQSLQISLLRILLDLNPLQDVCRSMSTQSRQRLGRGDRGRFLFWYSKRQRRSQPAQPCKSANIVDRRVGFTFDRSRCKVRRWLAFGLGSVRSLALTILMILDR